MSRRAAVADAFAGVRTVVALHAHPDDESLLTGGTLAALAATGLRVVLVTATDGEAGLTGDDGGPLGHIRRDELLAAARELGVHRVVRLGRRDSGVHGEAGGPAATDRFCDADVADVAREVVAVLREEGADVLLGYDPAGGYGHPDHRQVHRVARVAAREAGTPRLLEVTVDRRPLRPFLALIGLLRPLLPVPDLPRSEHGGWTRSSDIDLRLDVRDHVPAKQRALRAHASQGTGGLRTVAVLAALPAWLARRVLGTEWFLEVPDPGEGWTDPTRV